MTENPLKLMVTRLRTRAHLSDAAEAAILLLPYVERSYDPSAYIVREGMIRITYCSLVTSGYAYRQKLTADGSRQIVSFHMRGDLLDLQHMFLNRADHNIQALTRLQTVDIERSALRKLILEEPSIGEAMWIDALVDASIFREWVVNVGRRDARARIAHLLCEVAVRMDAAGIGDGRSYHLPMTQEQIGDAVGLTSVHVNRTLKTLAAEGVIKRSRREVWFDDWNAIRSVGDFSALYLHLDQVPRAKPAACA